MAQSALEGAGIRGNLRIHDCCSLFRTSKAVAVISEGFLPDNCVRRPPRAAARPSPVSNSLETALMSSFALASRAAPITACALAMHSLSVPQRRLGSAAVTAMPAIITLSRSVVHSAGVKSDLPAIGFPLLGAHSLREYETHERGYPVSHWVYSVISLVSSLLSDNNVVWRPRIRG